MDKQILVPTSEEFGNLVKEKKIDFKKLGVTWERDRLLLCGERRNIMVFRSTRLPCPHRLPAHLAWLSRAGVSDIELTLKGWCMWI